MDYVLTRPRSRLRARLEPELNERQREFVFSDAPAILGVAGPGSGKTRALTCRAARLLDEGLPPQNLMLVTFTNKAADEMRARLTHLLGPLPDGLWIGTFHALGARILRQYADLLDRTPSFTILDEEDSAALIRAVYGGLRHTGLSEAEKRLFVTGGLFGEIISRARNAGTTLAAAVAEYYPQHAEHLELIQRVEALYEHRKKEMNALDFDDLLVHWLYLLRNYPEVADQLRRRFRHVLVDEYQDTNVVQGAIVRELGLSAAVCVVGDDAQSIYAFRCAEIRNILEFPSHFPGCLVVRLEENYRSTPEILALANASIAHNRNQIPKKLFTRRAAGEKPWLVVAEDPSREAAFVAERLTEHHEAGVPLREMAVLYRSAYLAHDLEMELVSRGIPYVTVGGLKFLERAHVKDVLAWLRVLLNPRDEVSWQRIMVMQQGIGQATFQALMAQLRTARDPLRCVLQGELKVPPRAARGWADLVACLRELAAAQDRGPAELIAIVMDGVYGRTFRERYPRDHWERLQGIERLAGYARRFRSLENFIGTVSLEQDYVLKGLAEEEPAEDVLVLSTIHSAKGKEWRVVFLIGLNQGRFPSARGLDNLEEERRLFYVAVTRARDWLYLITTVQDVRGWQSFVTGPSIFLTELPREVYRSVYVREVEGDGDEGAG